MTGRGGYTRRLVLMAGGGLALAPPALAHRSQSVFTTVTWNGGHSSIDVTHRLHAHDAELGLAFVSGEAAGNDMNEAKNQARLGLYIEERFLLSGPQGAIPLTLLGAELEGQEILVYQEAVRTGPLDEVTVVNGILSDVFDQQTNLVNVRMATRTRTLLFSGRDSAKRIRDLL